MEIVWLIVIVAIGAYLADKRDNNPKSKTFNIKEFRESRRGNSDGDAFQALGEFFMMILALLFLFGFIASIVLMIGSIIHFNILGALGFFILAGICNVFMLSIMERYR